MVPTAYVREANEADLDAIIALYGELTGGAPVLAGYMEYDMGIPQEITGVGR